MNSVSLVLGILVLLPAFNEVWGDGCTGVLTLGFPVINMCEQKSATLGRVHLSVTTDIMGNNTRCGCTLRSKTPGTNTTTFFYLKANDSRASKCNQSLIHITPFDRVLEYYVQTFTCTTPIDSTSYTGITTSDVTITLTRPDMSVAVSYCIFVQPDRYIENDIELSCESNPMSNYPSTTSVTSTAPITTSSSSPPSPTPASSSPTTTSSVTSSVLTTPPSETPTPGATSDTPDTKSASTATSSTVTTDSSTTGGLDFPVAPVAGGVSAALVLIAVVVVVVIVCKRRQGRQKSPPPPVGDNAHANPVYSSEGPVSSSTSRPYSKTSSAMKTPSSSQTRPVQGILAPSSNPYELEEDEIAHDNGAVSINPAAGSAMMKLDTNGSQPPNPAANLYAVVNKPKGRQLQKPPPEKPPKPEDVRATPTGDEYAVVDKARKKGGNAKKKSSLPSTEATPPPVPPSPGLQYADLEEVRGEGRRPAPPQPPANMATGTEYAEINHLATARFSTEA